NAAGRDFERHMKNLCKITMCVVALLLSAALAQDAAPGNDAADLNSVLTRMDQNAKNFRTTQADFVWNEYQKVVNETDTQSGKIYFRRNKSGVEMAAHITQPTEKFVLFNEGKVRVYEPGIDQETVYNTGKNKADVESFMVLAFGGGGHALLKSFDVRYLGTEEAQGVKATKLELTPKSVKLRNTFSQILLWIDLGRGVTVQQEFVESAGDYRLDKFSNIQTNVSIPNDAFKLKTTGKTRIVSPQG
ncbi:MAG TPA: outer membrane lipoprotein carrier protein LolA, partial [Terriglobales bacterium]|nr:outer membrane lipoprotein carrier protein LolA [Terriglobales bacterium]